MAILFNAVAFVELLFEYGASLQRLALIGNPDMFKSKVMDWNRWKTLVYRLFLFSLKEDEVGEKRGFFS